MTDPKHKRVKNLVNTNMETREQVNEPSMHVGSKNRIRAELVLQALLDQ